MHQGGLAAQGQANHGALRQEGQALDLHFPQHHDSHRGHGQELQREGQHF